MKFKFMLPALALVVLAGCAKEHQVIENPVPQKGTFAFTSTTGDATKVALNADNSLYWTAGDQIAVYNYKDATKVQQDVALITSGEGTSVATFTPETHTDKTDWYLGGDGDSQAYVFSAFYPGSTAVPDGSKNVALSSVSASQREEAGVGAYIISWATANTTKATLAAGTAPNFAFEPKTALLKLSIRNSTSHPTNITAIKIDATGGNIAGNASLNLVTGVLSAGSASSITYTPAEPIQVAANATASVPVMISMLPCAATNLAVSFTEEDAVYGSVNIAVSSIESGKAYSKTATIASFSSLKFSIPNTTDQSAKSAILESEGLYYGTANCVVAASTATSISVNIQLFKSSDGYARSASSASPFTSAVTSAKIIWAENDLNNDANFKISSANLSTVTLSKSNGTTGNALLGIYDADGNILWSYHIWVPADATIYTKGADGELEDNGQTGANAQYSKAYKLALGQIENAHEPYMYYQWGRKDPLGRASSIASNPGLMATYGDGPSVSKKISATATGHSGNNLAYARQNPTMYILQAGEGTYDWYPTQNIADADHRNNSLWGASGTIYDPCPEGFHVPASNRLWYNSGNFTPSFTDNYFTKYGLEYVRGGNRHRTDAAVNNVASHGYTWSYGVTGVNAYFLSFDSTANPANYSSRAHGFGVRCVKD